MPGKEESGIIVEVVVGCSMEREIYGTTWKLSKYEKEREHVCSDYSESFAEQNTVELSWLIVPKGWTLLYLLSA